MSANASILAWHHSQFGFGGCVTCSVDVVVVVVVVVVVHQSAGHWIAIHIHHYLHTAQCQ